MKQNAAKLSEHICAEDGVDAAVEAVQRWLKV